MSTPSLDDMLQGHSPYEYVPSRTVAFIYVTLFSLTTIIHILQAVRYRMWWMFITVITCGSLEAVGWVGRLWSSYDVTNFTPFRMQITCTIMAPTSLLAASFVIFGKMIPMLGQSYSRLRPRLYTIVFYIGDSTSLTVQAIGGGLAASANTLDGANFGGNIMLGGIICQLVVIIIFCVCCTEYFIRYNKHSPISNRQGQPRGEFTQKLKFQTYTLAFGLLLLIIRAIYRTIELADGWTGRIITTEIYFNILDAAMILVAMFTMNVGHPGFLLTTPKEQFELKSTTGLTSPRV